MDKEIEQLQSLYKFIIEFFVNYSFQIIGAIIIILLGYYIAGKIASYVGKICEKYELDVTLTKYITSVIKIIIIIGTVIIALGKVGITLTPFIAAIGAASLGAGLALQGMLSNYGAGVSIIITRSFVVGDTITIKGYSGVVEDIKLGYTVLSTEDGEMITIPNKYIIGEILVNSYQYKVVESVVGIEYQEDPQKAVEILQSVLEKFDDSEISTKLKSQIGIKEFGDFSINLELRYWASTPVFYEVQYKVNMAIYEAFKQNNINIPFPTHNITMQK